MKRRGKNILACLGIGLALTLCGCGDDVKVIEGEVKTTTEGSTAEENGKAEEKSTASTASEGNEEGSLGSQASYKGYAFIYHDVIVEMDAKAAPIIEALGEPISYFEAASCAFEGLDKMYTYNSFEVDTYPTKDVDYISSVIFKDDAVTTAEGVGIGDSREKVEETYGDGGREEDGMLIYEKDEVNLCFILQDDSVISVEYHSTVLDE